MDYEKRYKAALKWMQSLYSGLHGATKEEAEKYFPELKESEDERIRKGLIEYLKADMEYNPSENKSFYEKSIAWLEKQEECSWKPTEEQFEALDYAYNSCPDTERGNYYEGVLADLIADLRKLYEKQDDEKGGEE